MNDLHKKMKEHSEKQIIEIMNSDNKNKDETNELLGLGCLSVAAIIVICVVVSVIAVTIGLVRWAIF